MASHSRTAPREDADGVRVLASPGARLVVWIAAAAMALVVVATMVAWLVLRGDPRHAAVSAARATTDAGVLPPPAPPVAVAPGALAAPKPEAGPAKPFHVA